MTIYLYIKECSHCQLKYFGRTIRNPLNYFGSGTYWKNHIKKYGKHHVKTINIWEFNSQEECTNFALNFSEENNIVESIQWANQTIETGEHRGSYSQSTEVKNKISKSRMGIKLAPRTKEHCDNIKKALLGKSHSAERRLNISKSKKGKKTKRVYVAISDEQKSKQSLSMKGKIPWNKKT